MPSHRSAWELNRQIMRQNGYEPKAARPSSNSGTPTSTPKQPDRSAKKHNHFLEVSSKQAIEQKKFDRPAFFVQAISPGADPLLGS